MDGRKDFTSPNLSLKKGKMDRHVENWPQIKVLDVNVDEFSYVKLPEAFKLDHYSPLKFLGGVIPPLAAKENSRNLGSCFPLMHVQ